MDGGLPASRQQSSNRVSKSMSTEVSKANGGLPANITNMAAALAQSSVSAGAAGGGELYMQFTKFGEWVFGAEKTETEEGSVWAINPQGFTHGFIAWDQDNTSQGPTGEVMVGEIATQTPKLSGDFSTVMKWTDKYRKMDVRTNADTPADAKRAREFGARASASAARNTCSSKASGSWRCEK